MAESVGEGVIAAHDMSFPVSSAIVSDYFEADDDACTAELLNRNCSVVSILRLLADTSRNRSVSGNKKNFRNLLSIKISDIADTTAPEYDSETVCANLSLYHYGNIIVGFIEDSDGKKPVLFT